MKKSLLAVALILSATAAVAGPKSFVPGEKGTTDNGRNYEKKYVNCSSKSEQTEVIYFEDIKKWCLADESYCNRDLIRTAKKACKQK